MEEKYQDLEYYRKVLKQHIKLKIGKAEQVEVLREWLSGHSHSWTAEFKPTGMQIFCKRLFAPPKDGDSIIYTVRHDPDKMYLRNKRSAQIVGANITPQSVGGLGGLLVPKVWGSNDNELLLLFECLEGETDRDKLIKIAEEKNEEKKTDFLYDASKRIARFDGLVNAYRGQFPEIVEIRSGKEYWVEVFIDNLLSIIRYQKNPDAGYEAGVNEALKKDLSQQGIDIVAEVHHLANLREKLEDKLRLQHGDCRVQHALGSKFVDLELFGLHYPGHDLVTYLSAEGGLARPSIEEFPRLLAHYLAYTKAYGESTPEARKEAIEGNQGLDTLERTEMGDKISAQTYAHFMMCILARTIEENLHLDGSNKRYGQEHLMTFIEGIPNYTIKESESARLTYTKELFELVAEQNTMMSLYSKPEVIRNYLCSLGNLLNKVEITEMSSETLKKIGNGQSGNQ